MESEYCWTHETRNLKLLNYAESLLPMEGDHHSVYEETYFTFFEDT